MAIAVDTSLSSSSTNTSSENESYSDSSQSLSDRGTARRAKRRVIRRAGRKATAAAAVAKVGDVTLSKIEERKIRNRQSAELSRKRKADYVNSIEKRVKTLSHDNQVLQIRIRALEEENKRLKSQSGPSLELSSSKSPVMERELIYESAALATLYYSIFSQQLEILAPLLNQNPSSSIQKSTRLKKHRSRKSSKALSSTFHTVAATSYLMSHFLLTVGILAMMSLTYRTSTLQSEIPSSSLEGHFPIKLTKRNFPLILKEVTRKYL
jgi:hypothetical protein